MSARTRSGSGPRGKIGCTSTSLPSLIPVWSNRGLTHFYGTLWNFLALIHCGMCAILAHQFGGIRSGSSWGGNMLGRKAVSFGRMEKDYFPPTFSPFISHLQPVHFRSCVAWPTSRAIGPSIVKAITPPSQYNALFFRCAVPVGTGSSILTPAEKPYYFTLQFASSFTGVYLACNQLHHFSGVEWKPFLQGLASHMNSLQGF